MKNFKGYIETDQFKIGCTGQTVYIYDKDGNEVKKFKDLIYAYASAVSPLGDLLIVKSTEGRLAVYSLKTLSLIKKFRFSKVNYAQDDGFCFSPDGKYFINIERHIDDLHSAISVYDTWDFSLVSRHMLPEDESVDCIECSDSEYYVLGCFRLEYDVEYFVAKFKDFSVADKVKITSREYDFLYLQLMSNRGYPLTEKENSKYLDLFKNAKYVRLVDLWKTRK